MSALAAAAVPERSDVDDDTPPGMLEMEGAAAAVPESSDVDDRTPPGMHDETGAPVGLVYTTKIMRDAFVPLTAMCKATTWEKFDSASCPCQQPRASRIFDEYL